MQHGGQLSYSQTPNEDSSDNVHTSSREEQQEEDEKSIKYHLTEEEDNNPDEQLWKEEDMEEEDGGVLKEMSFLKQQETDLSSPREEAEASQSSQDVGFWDNEEVDNKEEQQQRGLSVEEIIKQNWCYEDKEEEDV